MPIDNAVSSSMFPSKLHFVLFCTYVGLFVNQGILVTASREKDGSYSYLTTLVVILTETFKLVLAVSLSLRENSPRDLVGQIRATKRFAILYLIPAFLYCLYNNLAFVNLNHYDPTSYFILLNFRTVATGLIFQILFKKQLSMRQWTALILLTVGCIVKQGHFDDVSVIKLRLDFHLFLMLTQVMCSCLAGVYNEYLLKYVNEKDGSRTAVPVMIQNIYMYADSILMNLLFLSYTGSLKNIVDWHHWRQILFRPVVMAIVVNNGVAGITTSIFLKQFNSVLKTFAGAIELLLTAVVSYILFDYRIDSFMLVSIAFVSAAMYLYSQQPVVNVVMSNGVKDNKDLEKIGI